MSKKIKEKKSRWFGKVKPLALRLPIQIERAANGLILSISTDAEPLVEVFQNDPANPVSASSRMLIRLMELFENRDFAYAGPRAAAGKPSFDLRKLPDQGRGRVPEPAPGPALDEDQPSE